MRLVVTCNFTSSNGSNFDKKDTILNKPHKLVCSRICLCYIYWQKKRLNWNHCALNKLVDNILVGVCICVHQCAGHSFDKRKTLLVVLFYRPGMTNFNNEVNYKMSVRHLFCCVDICLLLGQVYSAQKTWPTSSLSKMLHKIKSSCVLHHASSTLHGIEKTEILILYFDVF